MKQERSNSTYQRLNKKIKKIKTEKKKHDRGREKEREGRDGNYRRKKHWEKPLPPPPYTTPPCRPAPRPDISLSLSNGRRKKKCARFFFHLRARVPPPHLFPPITPSPSPSPPLGYLCAVRGRLILPPLSTPLHFSPPFSPSFLPLPFLHPLFSSLISSPSSPSYSPSPPSPPLLYYFPISRCIHPQNTTVIHTVPLALVFPHILPDTISPPPIFISPLPLHSNNQVLSLEACHDGGRFSVASYSSGNQCILASVFYPRQTGSL